MSSSSAKAFPLCGFCGGGESSSSANCCSRNEIEPPLSVSVMISGNILAAMVEEANNDAACIEGVLIGTVRVTSSAEISDTEEDKFTLSTCIGITEFLSYRGRAPLRQQREEASMEVGVFSVRRDALEQPSFRDVVAARKLAAKRGRPCDAVIVVINIPERGQDPSWIISMHYSCFALDGNGSPRKIDLEVLSLVPENPFNFKSLLLHSTEHSLNDLTKRRVAADIAGSVETVLYAADYLSSIKKDILEVLQLESEVAVLRDAVSSAEEQSP